MTEIEKTIEKIVKEYSNKGNEELFRVELEYLVLLANREGLNQGYELVKKLLSEGYALIKEELSPEMSWLDQVRADVKKEKEARDE